MNKVVTIPGAERRSRRRHPSGRIPGVIPPPRYYFLAALTVVLTLFGLVMVLSASSVTAFHNQHIASPWYYVSKQAALAGFGFVALIVVARVPYHRWRGAIPYLYGVACLACLACFVPGVGRTVNGATSWVSFGPVQGQPSELLKLALLLYCADLLARRADRMHEPRATMGPCLVMAAIGGGIVVSQGDLGTTIVLASIVMAVLFVAGAPMRPMAANTGLLMFFGAIFVFSKGYRRARFTAFLHQAAEAGRFGYQVDQAKTAYGSGGIIGVGLGASRAKWGFLPEAHTDFIAAIVGEELGFVGVLVMVLLFGCFIVLGARVALRATDRFGMLLAGGVTAWVAAQVCINLGASTGLMPVTGLPLPFISFGPSSLVSLMVASGLLLSVARTSKA